MVVAMTPCIHTRSRHRRIVTKAREGGQRALLVSQNDKVRAADQASLSSGVAETSLSTGEAFAAMDFSGAISGLS